MIAATYCGADERLRGQRAILQPAELPCKVLAQFDDPRLGPAYALGWRAFGVHEFNLVLSDVVALERERQRRAATGTQAREVRLAEPTDPDYVAKTEALAAAHAGYNRPRRIGDPELERDRQRPWGHEEFLA